ncbi:MAG: diacylglycerol kinase family protein [Oscillospiraceae bacterium]|jgi:diacylglycerol kinase|nr:diacylglycerol kinase family protein [Oscillospiraceae bacterium]
MNEKLRGLRKSFAHAAGGIVFCARYERNMRAHIAAAAYALFFALYFYGLAGAKLAVLIITCVLVISLEMLNTAVEVLADKASPEYSALAKAAKDVAAGAVLIAAAGAVAVGVILFFDVGKFKEIAAFFGGNAFAAFALAASLALSVIFVFFTGKERRKRGRGKE